MTEKLSGEDCSLSHRGHPYTSEHRAIVSASGFFDVTQYLTENPEVAESGSDALNHFMEFGGFEGRDPNAYFSIAAYMAGHPEIGRSGLNPLVHFLIYNAHDDMRPFQDFDPEWYRATYSECLRHWPHPLGHYLNGGREMGCLRHAGDVVGPVQALELRVLFSAPPKSETVLFVTHAPEGRIKPHVPRYLDAFRDTGQSVTAIVVTDDLDSVEHPKIAPHCDGLILRENGGYDFSAWAHAADHVDLTATKLLFIANDSIVGPLDKRAFFTLIDRVRASSAELVGMTDNHQRTYHFQSFLFAVKGAGIGRLVDFFSTVAHLHSKQQVIMTYEVRLYDRLKAQGTTTEVLFPSGDTRDNRSSVNWRELVEEGFPFIKLEVLRKVSKIIWKRTLRKYGYPVECVDLSIQIANLTGSITSSKGLRRIQKYRRPSAGQYYFFRFLEVTTRPFSASKSMKHAVRAIRRKRRA